jgi:NADPH-dependent 2,4-dienoyl-CoA reductase/sulfur reductase-like enzyme
MKHVILGAGPAGVVAAETIRKHNPKDEIVLIGDEPEAPYSRMAIPYLLIGQVKEAGTYLRPAADHFSAQRITVLKGRRAAKLDSVGRKVTLDDGSSHSFDRLLIATGSSPNKPPIPGADGPGVHPCWTLADARAIAASAKPGARVLQMGAGFIGCIIMESLAARGVKLTVVEMGDRMVPRMMGATAGNMIKSWCQHKGVAVHTGASVKAIERPSNLAAGAAPMRVLLSNGQTVEADLVISAVGVRPNIGFLKESGIKTNVGVLTDVRMECNVSGIFAAGDCAEAFDLPSGKPVISAIQPNAADQARVAALNMAGVGSLLNRVPQINVLDTLGLISTSFGNWEGVKGGQHVELTEPNKATGGRHLSLQFDGDVMVGCNSVGWTDHVGVMRGLVDGKVPLGAWKDKLLKDPTHLMAAYLDCAQAQSAHAHLKA